ncbi:MAG: A24 family peptidase [Legionellaceae bacterium]|nr:A24 family peptidase [Legionellaceae bacterium]
MLNTLITLHPVASWIILGIGSLFIGSFLNVVIYRLPLMIETDWKTQCRQLLQLPNVPSPKPINLCLPRSHCPSCNQLIPAWHNIPLLSYMILRGQCHACHHRISWRYPVVELLCLGLSLLAGYCFGFHLSLVFALLFIGLLLCLSCIDLQHQLLPDGLTLGLLWLGLLANTQTLFTTLPDAVWSAAGAYLGLWLFIKIFYLLTGKIGMGNGDFKLFAALGAWFGWNSLLPILLGSSILGSVIGLSYLGLTGKTKETPIPFGPFLCIAGYGYLLFWY